MGVFINARLDLCIKLFIIVHQLYLITKSFLFGPFNIILLFTLTHYILLFLETKEGVESESISADGV